MPESPDFDQIAREIIAACVIERNSIDAGHGTGTVPRFVTDYLRQVWNARGAAYLATIQAIFDAGGDEAEGRGLQESSEAISSLDR